MRLPTVLFVAPMHVMGGVAGAVGYLALLGLLAVQLGGHTRGRASVALAATGERPLTSYLLLSAVMAPLLAAWGLGLGDDIGTLAAYGIAIVAWLLAVVLAVWLEAKGRPGPAEWLLRRLTLWSWTRRPKAADSLDDAAATLATTRGAVATDHTGEAPGAAPDPSEPADDTEADDTEADDTEADDTDDEGHAADADAGADADAEDQADDTDAATAPDADSLTEADPEADGGAGPTDDADADDQAEATHTEDQVEPADTTEDSAEPAHVPASSPWEPVTAPWPETATTTSPSEEQATPR